MVEYDEAKLTELVLYVAQCLEEDPAGGAVKLNKVLFFAEFAHVRAHGVPITGAEYQRLENGPAPRRLLPVRRELIGRGDAELRRETYLGKTQQRLIARRPPNLDLFAPSELKAVGEALVELRGQSATAVSDRSHEELGYQIVKDGETIPFETAYLRPPIRTASVQRHAEQLAAERSRR